MSYNLRFIYNKFKFKVTFANFKHKDFLNQIITRRGNVNGLYTEENLKEISAGLAHLLSRILVGFYTSKSLSSIKYVIEDTSTGVPVVMITCEPAAGKLLEVKKIYVNNKTSTALSNIDLISDA